MASYQVMSWRGIPAQVRVTDDSGTTVSRPLPASFQQEIDRVAMREGFTGSDEYLEGWAWSEPFEATGTGEEIADRVVEQLVEARRSADRRV